MRADSVTRSIGRDDCERDERDRDDDDGGAARALRRARPMRSSRARTTTIATATRAGRRARAFDRRGAKHEERCEAAAAATAFGPSSARSGAPCRRRRQRESRRTAATASQPGSSSVKSTPSSCTSAAPPTTAQNAVHSGSRSRAGSRRADRHRGAPATSEPSVATSRLKVLRETTPISNPSSEVTPITESGRGQPQEQHREAASDAADEQRRRRLRPPCRRGRATRRRATTPRSDAPSPLCCRQGGHAIGRYSLLTARCARLGPVRRKPGALLPLEVDILEVAVTQHEPVHGFELRAAARGRARLEVAHRARHALQGARPARRPRPAREPLGGSRASRSRPAVRGGASTG